MKTLSFLLTAVTGCVDSRN